VPTINLSQKWTISKPKTKKDLPFHLSFLKPDRHSLVLSMFQMNRVESFRLTPTKPSLQEILDSHCTLMVQEVIPIVETHLQREIIIPRVRIYVPLSVSKKRIMTSKEFLITSQSIIFFTLTPNFPLIYRAIILWVKQYR
jgi:hypothetical protein